MRRACGEHVEVALGQPRAPGGVVAGVGACASSGCAGALEWERVCLLHRTQLTAARAALDAGQPVDQVAAAFSVSRANIYRNLAERDIEHPATH